MKSGQNKAAVEYCEKEKSDIGSVYSFESIIRVQLR